MPRTVGCSTPSHQLPCLCPKNNLQAVKKPTSTTATALLGFFTAGRLFLGMSLARGFGERSVGMGMERGAPLLSPLGMQRCQLAQCQGCWLLTEPSLFWPLPMPPVTAGSQRLLPAGWSRGERKSGRWGGSFPAGVRAEPDLHGAAGMLRCVGAPQHQELLAAAGSTEERGDPQVMEGFRLCLGHQWGCGQLGVTSGCWRGLV